MIDSFSGEYAFLSNFYPRLDEVSKNERDEIPWIPMQGHSYPTVEHAFQAAKTLDETERLQIRNALRPGQAKRLGRQVQLRPGWNDYLRLAAMFQLVERKFEHHALAERLYLTYPQLLVEGNNWNDRFWGMCRGEGENHLGKILMIVRQGIVENRDRLI